MDFPAHKDKNRENMNQKIFISKFKKDDIWSFSSLAPPTWDNRYDKAKKTSTEKQKRHINIFIIDIFFIRGRSGSQ